MEVSFTNPMVFIMHILFPYSSSPFLFLYSSCLLYLLPERKTTLFQHEGEFTSIIIDLHTCGSLLTSCLLALSVVGLGGDQRSQFHCRRGQ